MKYLIPLLFIIPALINLLPVFGVLSADNLNRLYDTGTLSSDLALLMRHRAVLFGIVGVLLLYAAFEPSARTIAALAGLVSMVSFVLLVYFDAAPNAKLVRIGWIDVAASLPLLVGLVLHWRNPSLS